MTDFEKLSSVFKKDMSHVEFGEAEAFFPDGHSAKVPYIMLHYGCDQISIDFDEHGNFDGIGG